MAVLVDEHVGGLDVAVHEPTPMRGVERFGDLREDRQGTLERQAALVPSSVRMSLPSTKRIAR